MDKQFEIDFDIERVLRDRGVQYSTNSKHFILKVCPTCSGKSKLYIDKVEKFWVCFKCVKTSNFAVKEGRGNLWTLLLLIGFDREEAKRVLRDGRVRRYVDADMFYRETKEEKVRLPELSLPPSFIPLECTVDSVRSFPEVYRYLISRNVSSRDRILEYDLRYSVEMKRLIFPVYERQHFIVGWQARDITDRWKTDQHKCPDAECSLVNKWYFRSEGPVPSRCPECGGELELQHYAKSRNSKDFPKSELLFNQHNIDWSKPVSIVEGPFDSINTPNSVAMLGKVLSKQQVNILLAKKPPTVIIYTDGDEAGVSSAAATADQLTCFFDDVRYARLCDGLDPGSFSLDENAANIARALPAKDCFNNR